MTGPANRVYSAQNMPGRSGHFSTLHCLRAVQILGKGTLQSGMDPIPGHVKYAQEGSVVLLQLLSPGSRLPGCCLHRLQLLLQLLHLGLFGLQQST